MYLNFALAKSSILITQICFIFLLAQWLSNFHLSSAFQKLNSKLIGKGGGGRAHDLKGLPQTNKLDLLRLKSR